MRTVVRMSVISLLMATSLQAITYIVPSDRDLVKRAEAIVIATAVESHAELRDGQRIVTVATLQVERVLKGSVGETAQLVELGGAVGDRFTFIPGSPRYEDGKRYLVFLRTNNAGEWMTFGFGLGKFEFISDLHGRELLTRNGTDEGIFGLDESDGALHVERLRDGPGFLSFVESCTTAEAPSREEYFVNSSDVVFATFPEFRPRVKKFVPIALSTTRPDYLLAGNFRWHSPSASFLYCCSAQTGGTGLDGPSASSAAMAVWNSVPGAGISYILTGPEPNQSQVPNGLGGNPDGKNDIIFDDRHGIIGNSGAIAVGGISNTGASYTIPGDSNTYIATTEVDVETGNNLPSFVDQALFIQFLTHELGHTLGFRHADGTSNPFSPQNNDGGCQQPSPCAAVGQAIMASVIPKPNNIGSLGQWDNDAAQTVYGSGPVCNAPQVTTQPASQSITSGNQANLSVAASGTGTLTYQWYIGTSGTTTTPVNGATSTTFHPSPATTTSYWVRVTNACNPPTADSNTAVVTVTCAPPNAPAPVPSPSSIAFGQSSTISESPTGTGPFTYQWYIGISGTTTSPIAGATNSSVTVSPTSTTSYWVRVTGQCAPPADSPATSVTVAPCVPPTAPTPIASPQSINAGQSSTLSVNPSGSSPLTYQWYVGDSGTTTSQIGGATNSFVSVSPSVTTNYWVRVTGPCAPPSDSPTQTVTVTCSPIAGNLNVSPNPINPGQSSTLTVPVTGSGPFTYQWYNGNPGDTSSPIPNATNQNIIVSPTTTSMYWVRVVAPCGSQDAGALVNVNGVCTAASITTHPSSVTIPSGSAATLSVVAAGTAPISYQWYTGTSGDLSHPITGATNASVTVTPVTTITTYWVHVSNSCNTVGVNSTTGVVTLSATCPSPTITTQPLGVSAGIGTVATLKVVATGVSTLHYQWYKGLKGDLSTKVGTDSATFTTGVSVTTSYWVRVSVACGSFTDANAAIVTATAPPRGRAVRH